METKVCSKCGRELPLNNFSSHLDCKYGVSNKCKECSNKYRKEHYRKNKEKVKNIVADYRRKNKKLIKERQKKYNSLETTKEKKREYRIKNREKINRYLREWHKSNPELTKLYTKKWYQNNKEYHYQLVSKRNSIIMDVSDGTRLHKHDIFIKSQITHCHICGEKLTDENTHMDHIFPVKGKYKNTVLGIHSKYNVWPICASCNLSKSNNNPYDWNRYVNMFGRYLPNFLMNIEMAIRMSKSGLIEQAEVYYKKAYDIGKKRSDSHRDFGFIKMIISDKPIPFSKEVWI